MMFDHFIFMLHAVEGKIKYFDEVMSVWRRHGGGYTWLQTQDKGLFFQKEGEDWIIMYEKMDDFFNKRFTWQIRERIFLALRYMVSNCIETGNIDHLRFLVDKYKDYFEIILKDAVLIDAKRIAYPTNPEFFPPWESSQHKLSNDVYIPEENIVSKTTGSITIGGYHIFNFDDIPVYNESIWNVWIGNQEYGRFFNLRSALMRWLWQNSVTTVWLPSYLPPILTANLRGCQFTRKFYSVNSRLEPDTAFISQVDSGEAVLTISYLGRPISEELAMALFARKDILWIEDRAQALTPVETSANAVIYSPRKLCGVPDGGLLVGKGASELETWCTSPSSKFLEEREVMLLEQSEQSGQVDGKFNLRYLKYDLEHQLSRRRMSRTTEALLCRIPFQNIVDKRRRNWIALFRNLGEFCLWDIPCPDFAPFAFPFLVPSRLPSEVLHTLLMRHNIICQRMWYPLFEEKNRHPIEENLSKKLLLLPCDHRYDEDDMNYLSNFVREIIYNKSGIKFNEGKFDF